MIYHVGAYEADNAGDLVILDLMQKIISTIDDEIVKVDDYKVQPDFDAPLVVGGGGLLLRDSRPNYTSDWRWNISTERLEMIEQPIIVFALGFNKFRGQRDFAPVFSEHLKLLIEKSIFFSLREKASIKRLEPYVGDLVDRIWWQPCPASFAGKFYDKQETGDYTIFAPAMDRIALRGNIAKIVPVLKQIPNLKIAVHVKHDLKFLDYFDGDVADLRWAEPQKTCDFYSGAKQVIGMRMHSCLIPFGFGVPVIPLISHNKLVDWLEDIGHPDWGVELSEAEKVADHLGADQTDLVMRDRLHEMTQINLKEIKRLLWEQ